MQEEPLVTAATIVRELGIPRSTLYRLVSEHRIPVHSIRQPWHQRQRIAFKLSEVRAALGLPDPEPPPS